MNWIPPLSLSQALSRPGPSSARVYDANGVDVTDIQNGVVQDGHTVHRTFLMIDKGLSEPGQKPNDASAGRAAAQELLRREGRWTGEQPPPPDGGKAALASRVPNTDATVTDAKQAAYEMMRRGIATAWARDAANAPYTRPAAPETIYAQQAALQGTSDAAVNRSHADRMNARSEMVDYLANAWKGAAA